MLGNIGGAELIFIMLMILLLFGAKRIPEIARGLGQGIREFKKATSELSRELKMEDDMRRHRSPDPIPVRPTDTTPHETATGPGAE